MLCLDWGLLRCSALLIEVLTQEDFELQRSLRTGNMACLMVSAGMAGVFSSSQLSSRSAFSSQSSGLSGACAPVSVAPRGLAVRAAGTKSA